MMLNDLEFNPFYNTYDNDIASEFYTKALSNAVSYKRVSAYFSAKALAYYSKGISEIVKKNGKIDFIISKEISEETYNAIVDGYKKREEIEQELIQSLKEEVSLKEEKRLSNLAFLIEIGVVDIKIAFVKKGIFHDKFGVIEDEYNNIVYFRGSNNETVEAIEKEYNIVYTDYSFKACADHFSRIFRHTSGCFDQLRNRCTDTAEEITRIFYRFTGDGDYPFDQGFVFHYGFVNRQGCSHILYNGSHGDRKCSGRNRPVDRSLNQLFFTSLRIFHF